MEYQFFETLRETELGWKKPGVPKIKGKNLTEANPRETTFRPENQEFCKIQGLNNQDSTVSLYKRNRYRNWRLMHPVQFTRTAAPVAAAAAADDDDDDDNDNNDIYSNNYHARPLGLKNTVQNYGSTERRDLKKLWLKAMLCRSLTNKSHIAVDIQSIHNKVNPSKPATRA